MITLTKSAADRIADQLNKNNAVALRFAAKESGCSGYSYVMGFAESIADEDTIFENYNVKVAVDPKSLGILSGTQIDYVAEGLNQTFKFSTPNATDQCGCGESFAIQPESLT
ncbi:MAG: iron-sulfur cluster assembly protein [Cryomorphaceae bacterium]|jgi:iron-sulfur cluster assembly protein